MCGQYALACAARIPDRVTHNVVIAGAVPLDDDTAFLGAQTRWIAASRGCRNTILISRARRSARRGEIARHSPDVWAHLTTRGAVPDEAAAITALPDPGIPSAAAAALEHGEGMVEEYHAWVRPWGFAPEAIAGSVTIWQGDADELVPPKWGEQLAHSIPNARLELLAGEGHFLGYRHQAEVLRAFLNA